MNIKSIINVSIIAIISIVFLVLGICGGFNLTELQKDALTTVAVVAAIAAAYCFIVGEISRNNSQMDKLWSILPAVYLWIIAVKGDMELRLIMMAVIATLWGIRLTYNFGRKGAYSIKFWAGEEDYRWILLRKHKLFRSRIVWAVFDLFFISFYQNFVVLAITLPAIAVMGSDKPLGIWDLIACVLAIAFLLLELIADEQQWKFHQEKKRLLAEGRTLAELPMPYRRGFNTTGLWACSRHPNYLGEQSIWISLYIFTIGAGAAGIGIFNWSIAGSMLLVLLFLGSSTLAEGISGSKYSEYKTYCNSVPRYLPLPWRKYN